MEYSENGFHNDRSMTTPPPALIRDESLIKEKNNLKEHISRNTKLNFITTTTNDAKYKSLLSKHPYFKSEWLKSEERENLYLSGYKETIVRNDENTHNHKHRYSSKNYLFDTYACRSQTQKNIKLICETLINSGNLTRLHRFVSTLHEKDKQLEIVFIARAYIAFQTLNLQELIKILTVNEFSPKYHRQLQLLWIKAKSILQNGISRAKIIASASEGIRRRTCNEEHNRDNSETGSYYFSRETRTKLNEIYERTTYPSAQEKVKLAEETKLTITQVSNWFKNKRQRARAVEEKPKVISRNVESYTDTNQLKKNQHTSRLMLEKRFIPEKIYPYFPPKYNHLSVYKNCMNDSTHLDRLERLVKQQKQYENKEINIYHQQTTKILTKCNCLCKNE